MLFGFVGIVTGATFGLVAFAVIRIEGLRRDVADLKEQVNDMESVQDQTLAMLNTVNSEVATMAANYAAAGAANIAKAVSDAEAAWQADDDVKWRAALKLATDTHTAMAAGQPITPPATPDVPKPTPVAAPATDGSTPTPSAPNTEAAPSPAPADTTAPVPSA